MDLHGVGLHCGVELLYGVPHRYSPPSPPKKSLEDTKGFLEDP